MELNKLFTNIGFFDISTDDIDNKEVMEINLFPYLLIFSVEKSLDNEIVYSEFVFYVTEDERKKGYAYNNFDSVELLEAAKAINSSISKDYNIIKLYELENRILNKTDKEVLKTIFIISLYIMLSKFVLLETNKYSQEKEYIPKEIFNEYMYLISLEIMDKIEKYNL